ncbi:MAG: PAC2 family protein, partial [Candidatus Woesearchaeota archaeon]
MKWHVSQIPKKLPEIKNPILFEGLPGIGNVGKIAIDFLIDELKAKKIYEIYSHSFPNSVFVNEKNLVELPIIEIFHVKYKNQDILFMTGDIQPIDEVSSYEFCDLIIEL